GCGRCWPVPRHYRFRRGTLVTLGDLTKPVPVLMLLGFVLIAGLNYRRVLGGTLIGTLIVTAIGLPL
ncbi:MAG: hypothetical protein WB497_23425, partial [Pseudolabrys sp.]